MSIFEKPTIFGDFSPPNKGNTSKLLGLNFTPLKNLIYQQSQVMVPFAAKSDSFFKDKKKILLKKKTST